jgi:HNH endonuclease
MAHYLYPLNPKSRHGYFFEDAFGNRFPTSLEGFLDCYRGRGEAAEWGVAKCGSRLKKGDYIWAYFSKPVGAVMAVGRVRQEVHFMAEQGRDGVWIDWDWKLTDKLLESPIPGSSLKQSVFASVTPIGEEGMKVIERWMGGRRGRQWSPSRKVTFKTVEVEQRQGQPAFRQALMSAYKNGCAVSGCSVRDVLQAAHVVAVKDKGDHGVSNGILLRADLHNLFDRGLMYFDQTGRVRFADVVKDDEYTRYEGKRCALVLQNVDKRALELHRKKHKR